MTKRFRTLKSVLCASLALGSILAASPASAQSPATAMPLETQFLGTAPMDLRTFYATQENKSLWVAQDGTLDPAADMLLKLIQTSAYDGLDPAGLQADQLAAAIDRTRTDRSPVALTAADVALSGALAAYVKAMLEPNPRAMMYEHPNLQPFVPNTQIILENAAKATSLQDYLSQMQWMHPLYAPIRMELLKGDNAINPQALAANLARLRAIPANPGQRYVLIDIASARLWMYENGVPVDTMKVVVGKVAHQTPIMAGYIRYATFNPYWNVPDYLVWENIAPRARTGGAAYLKKYQIISDWAPDAKVLPSTGIDWRAVQNRTVEVKMREVPGPTNSMGHVKFEFPNPEGIYLHDTPERDYLKRDARQLSNGCIRLEDADRLGRWLFSGPMPTVSRDPEQKVDLPAPVPVYITYLTAQSDGTQIALGRDPYGLDAPAPARAGGSALALGGAAPAAQSSANVALGTAAEVVQP